MIHIFKEKESITYKPLLILKTTICTNKVYTVELGFKVVEGTGCIVS
jgi:hypothetical protein